MRGFWRLIALLKKYKGLLTLSITCNILMAIFTVVSIPLIIPFFQVLFDRMPEAQIAYTGDNPVEITKQWFTNLIYAKGKEQALLIVCISLGVIFFFKNLFRYLAKFFMAPIRNGVIRDLRRTLYQRYLDVPLSYHIARKKGDLMSRMAIDVQEVDFSILNVVETIFKSPLLILGSIGFMLYVSPTLTLFTFVLLLFTAIVIGSIAKALKNQSASAQQKIANINSHLEESLTAIKITKAFNAEDFLKEKFDQENDSYTQVLNRILKRRDLSSPLSEFLGVGVVITLLWFGSTLVFNQTLQPETFFAFVFAFYNVIEPAKTFSSAYYNIQKGLAALDRIHEIQDAPSENIDSGGEPIDGFSKQIVFDDVSFTYPDETIPVLEKVSFSLEKGQTLAIVGPSGGGKTTIVDLLCRFFTPTSGMITIDGKNIQDLHLADVRSLLGIVSQDTVLFNDSVANNISFNKPDISLQEIERAAHIANAEGFIQNLPLNYQTKIGDQGVKLSGGQKQRLAIARAILHNPPIFILDEATSNLDSESEKAVQASLDHLLQNKTAIVIAHRLSTIQKADHIVVIEKGMVVEQGNHEQLIKNQSTYCKLVQMQSL